MIVLLTGAEKTFERTGNEEAMATGGEGGSPESEHGTLQVAGQTAGYTRFKLHTTEEALHTTHRMLHRAAHYTGHSARGT